MCQTLAFPHQTHTLLPIQTTVQNLVPQAIAAAIAAAMPQVLQQIHLPGQIPPAKRIPDQIVLDQVPAQVRVQNPNTQRCRQ